MVLVSLLLAQLTAFKQLYRSSGLPQHIKIPVYIFLMIIHILWAMMTNFRMVLLTPRKLARKHMQDTLILYLREIYRSYVPRVVPELSLLLATGHTVFRLPVTAFTTLRSL
jgi:hypothetical protein